MASLPGQGAGPECVLRVTPLPSTPPWLPVPPRLLSKALHAPTHALLSSDTSRVLPSPALLRVPSSPQKSKAQASPSGPLTLPGVCPSRNSILVLSLAPEFSCIPGCSEPAEGLGVDAVLGLWGEAQWAAGEPDNGSLISFSDAGRGDAQWSLCQRDE